MWSSLMQTLPETVVRITLKITTKAVARITLKITIKAAAKIMAKKQTQLKGMRAMGFLIPAKARAASQKARKRVNTEGWRNVFRSQKTEKLQNRRFVWENRRLLESENQKAQNQANNSGKRKVFKN